MSRHRLVKPVRFWVLHTLLVTPIAAVALFASGFQLLFVFALFDLLVTGGELSRDGLPGVGLYFLEAYAVGAPATAIYVALLLEWQRRRGLGALAAVGCSLATSAVVALCLIVGDRLTDGAVLGGFGPLQQWLAAEIVVVAAFTALWVFCARLRFGVDAVAA